MVQVPNGTTAVFVSLEMVGPTPDLVYDLQVTQGPLNGKTLWIDSRNWHASKRR